MAISEIFHIRSFCRIKPKVKTTIQLPFHQDISSYHTRSVFFPSPPKPHHGQLSISTTSEVRWAEWQLGMYTNHVETQNPTEDGRMEYSSSVSLES